MTDAIISLVSILAIVGIAMIWFKWFPKRVSSDFRIKEKTVGKYQYYKAQVKRPLFGWWSFYASVHDGGITSYGSWDRDKEDAEKRIRAYKDLRPLGVED
jgi:hypothetical protein